MKKSRKVAWRIFVVVIVAIAIIAGVWYLYKHKAETPMYQQMPQQTRTEPFTPPAVPQLQVPQQTVPYASPAVPQTAPVPQEIPQRPQYLPVQVLGPYGGALLLFAFIIGMIWFVTRPERRAEAHMPEPGPLRTSSPLPVPAPAPGRVPEPEEHLTPEEARELRRQVGEYRRTISDLRAQEARVEDIERENRELNELVESLKHERDILLPKTKALDQILKLANLIVIDLSETLGDLDRDKKLYTGILTAVDELLNNPAGRTLIERHNLMQEWAKQGEEQSIYDLEKYPRVLKRVSIQIDRFKKFINLLVNYGVKQDIIRNLRLKADTFELKLAELQPFYTA